MLGYQPPGSRPPPPGSRPPLDRRSPLWSACWEIRSTSGWYTSYWNGILLNYKQFPGGPNYPVRKFCFSNSSIRVQDNNIYCPQRSCGKVTCMFLHVSAILFTGGGLPHCKLGYTPQDQTSPQTRYPPGPGTPWSRHPPCTVHTGRYEQQAGGI